MFYFKLFLVALWCPIGCCLAMLYAFICFWDSKRFARGLRLMGWGIIKIFGITIVVEGAEIVDQNRPCVYVGNHQSALDLVTFAKIMPANMTTVAKSELRWVPFLGWWYWAVGGSFIKRKNREEAIQELKRLGDRMNKHGLSVAMMPEGTRNRKGRGLLPFKKGPFHLAIFRQVPIVPVISSPLDKVANFDSRTLTPGTVIIHSLDPIPTKGLTANDVDALTEKVRNVMLKGLEELEKRSDALH